MHLGDVPKSLRSPSTCCFCSFHPRTALYNTNHYTHNTHTGGKRCRPDMPSSATKKGGGGSSGSSNRGGLSTPSPSSKGEFLGTEGDGAVQDTSSGFPGHCSSSMKGL